MRLIQQIEFFYQEEINHQLILCSQGSLHGAQRSAADLLEILCEANGRSVQGSMDLFAKVNHAHQKLAVLVDPSSQEIYFPTHSPENSQCIWVNYGKVKHVTKVHGNHCLISFYSGTVFEVPCSVRVIRRQLQRCQRLLDSLHNPYEQINDLFYQI